MSSSSSSLLKTLAYGLMCWDRKEFLLAQTNSLWLMLHGFPIDNCNSKAFYYSFVNCVTLLIVRISYFLLVSQFWLNIWLFYSRSLRLYTVLAVTQQAPCNQEVFLWASYRPSQGSTFPTWTDISRKHRKWRITSV